MSQEKRALGQHEQRLNEKFEINNEGLQVIALSLLTRQPIDEGLLKCALQEFQHSHPQLLSRIRNSTFLPMVCPVLPLAGQENENVDKESEKLLSSRLDTKNGPLWRVRLVTRDNFDQIQLGLGPELRALLGRSATETDEERDTRWHSFLRYMQGKVNQSDIASFDSSDQGYSSLIIMSFHPSIADTLSIFHFTRGLMTNLEAIVGSQSNNRGVENNLESFGWPLPIESLVGYSEQSQLAGKLAEFLPKAAKAVVSEFFPYYPIASSMGALIRPRQLSGNSGVEVLRGWLDVAQSKELNALMQEEEVGMLAVILAASLAVASKCISEKQKRDLEDQKSNSEPKTGQILEHQAFKVAVETNMRRYCHGSNAKFGANSIDYVNTFELEASRFLQLDKETFWQFVHEISERLSTQITVNKDPMKQLSASCEPSADMKVSAFGELGHFFRFSDSVNVRLEDVFHVAHEPNFPVCHRLHLLNNRLHYIMSYNSESIEQRTAFVLRDETLAILRMACEK